MLALAALAVTLAASPDVPRSARLLDDAPLLAQAELPPPLPEPGPTLVPQVSSLQLQADIAALRRERPSLGGGIALVSTGGGLVLLGGYFFLMNALTSSFTGSFTSGPLFPIGVLSLTVGLPLTVIGVWLLYNRIDQRKRIDTELKLLRQELQGQPRLNPLSLAPAPLHLAAL